MPEASASLDWRVGIIRFHGGGGGFGTPFSGVCFVERDWRNPNLAVLMGMRGDIGRGTAWMRAVARALLGEGFTLATWQRRRPDGSEHWAGPFEVERFVGRDA